MKDTSPTQRPDQALRDFYARNPSFDILTAELHPHHSDSFNWEGLDRAQVARVLQARQRLLRLGHGEEVADALHAAGFDSAHKIALLPERTFVRENAHIFEGGAEQAGAVHRSAAGIKQRVKHLWANVKDMVASRHYQATLFHNVAPEVAQYFQSIPSYEDLFGGLNFCACQHCRSIFGPAAYFLDMMRLTDQYITEPNSHRAEDKIPPKMKLEERRPDLFTLKLDCANTNDMVSYLHVVNRVLETRVATELRGENAYKAVAVAPFPFNLPFHLPLEQIRIHLGELKTSLFDIFQTFLIPEQNWKAFQNPGAAREYLKISAEQSRLVTTPRGEGAELAAAYGYSLIRGKGRVKFSGSHIVGTGTDFLREFKVGDQIVCDQISRTVYLVSTENLIYVLPAWPRTVPEPVEYEISPLSRLQHLDEFMRRTGLSREQVSALLVQNLDEAELNQNLANHFFINNTGEALPYMRVVVDKKDPNKPYEKIENLSPARLDRLSRFIRLAGWLGWSYADLNWAMVSSGANEITEAFIERAAGISYLHDVTQTPVDLLCSFWHYLKDIGRVSAVNPQDAFDRVFNNPALLDGQSPYDPNNPPVFDPSRPVEWRVDDRSGLNGTIRSRLTGALVVNDNDLTKAANYVSRVYGTPGTVKLTTTNLTGLYKATKLASVYRLSVDAFLRLLSLVGYPAETQPRLPGSLDAVLSLKEQADWLNGSAFDVYELQYVITGQTNEFVNPGYKREEIGPFLENLSVSSEGSRVAPAQFIFEDIDGDEAEPIARQLYAHRLTNRFGLIFNRDLTYNSILALAAVTPASLVTDDISERSAQTAYELLRGRSLIDQDGFLSPQFGPRTDLNFLFENEPGAEIKRGEVRSRLLQIQGLVLLVRPDSFITDGIGASESSAAFTLLHERQVIDKHGRLGQSFGAHTDLSYLFPGLEKAEFMRGEVRSVLLQVKKDIEHTVEVLRVQKSLQEEFVLTGLGQFLGATSEMMRVLLRFTAARVHMNDYLVELLTPLEGDGASFTPTLNVESFTTADITKQASKEAFEKLVANAIITAPAGETNGTVALDFGPLTALSFLFEGDANAERKRAQVRDVLLRSLRPARVYALVAGLSREILLGNRLGLTPAEAKFVIESPKHLEIRDLRHPTFGDVRMLATFKLLLGEFRDTNNALIGYFRMPKAGQCPNPKIKALAELTGWNQDQICKLIELFWPGDIAGASDYDTVAGLLRLKACFNLGSRTGIDVLSLKQLADLHALSLINQDGTFNDVNWGIYVSAARSTLDAVNAKYDDEDFKEVAGAITGLTDTLKRDALVGFAVWLLGRGRELDFIQTPSDLYQYLLIDVEMSGCAQTTLISQAIASVQLYMQRCRMSLEDGVTDLEIPDEWWVWVSNYRVWEANRKVFLYPENYIEPSLRRDQTPPFRQLSEALLQTDINDQTVADAYADYFTEFTILSNLIVCGSYSHTEVDRARDQEVETLYVFGRTNTEPFTYYYRTLKQGDTWSPWQRVEASIAAPYVTPVFAFGRLFIFWAELSRTGGSTIKAGGTGNESESQAIVNATIKYSFRGVNNQWSPSQTLADNIPAHVAPDLYLKQRSDDVKKLFQTKDLAWQQPYALQVSRGIPGSGRITVEGQTSVVGKETKFKREVRVGDQLWCAGETRVVKEVTTNTALVVEKHWNVTARGAEYKIIPRDLKRNGFAPFQGTTIYVEIKGGGRDVLGHGTSFKTEVSVGDRIMCGKQSRFIAHIENNNRLWVDGPWDGPEGNRQYNRYTIFPGATGEERLLVLYGTAARSLYSLEDTLPDPPTPVDSNDNFTAQLNAFNESLYESLTLDKQAPGLAGGADVTFGLAGLVDADLLHRAAPFVIADYKFSQLPGQAPPRPYGPALDRPSETLLVRESDNTLADNYWGNSAPGTRESLQAAASVSADLLFNISSSSAMLSNVINRPGQFVYYNGDETFLVRERGQRGGQISDMIFVRPSYYLRLPHIADRPREYLKSFLVSCGAYTDAPRPFGDLRFAFTRISTAAAQPLSQRLFAGGTERLLTLASQELPELPFSRFYLNPDGSPPPAVIPPAHDRLDFAGAYGDYFWEIFFHGPFLIAEGLRARRRFDEARRWYQYVFDPTARPDTSDTHPNDRYWRFLPLRHLRPENLAAILSNAKQIRAYNDDPFNPDAIARLRPAAYAKAVVMRYIDNLLDWGDFLFTQDTQESITQATNLYVMAADLLGKRPEAVGVCPVPRAKNFGEIRREYSGVVNEGVAQGGGEDYIKLAAAASSEDDFYMWMRIEITSGAGAGQRRTIASYSGADRIARLETDWEAPPDSSSRYKIFNDIPQFLIELENTTFAYAQGLPQFRDVPFNDINSYFCVPENEEFIRYWDQVEDRLFKIRHCMNIQGVERSLAPFAPQINPRELVRAAATGGSGYQLASQVEPPVPHYRFAFILDAAKGLAANLTQLGASLLSALEKQDAEELALLRASQEAALLNLTTAIKQNQIVEIEQTRQALIESRDAAKARGDYYTQLLTEGLSAGELQSLKSMETAMILNVAAGSLRIASSIGYAIPNLGSPFAITYGGQQIGAAVGAASSALELGSYVTSYNADRSLTMANYGRRTQEWSLQASLAGYDFSQISGQIAAAETQRKLAELDLAAHRRALEQSREAEEFIKGKFTNRELYQWMVGRLGAAYFQTYALAFELVRSAQRAFQYELSSEQTFVNFGYWESVRAGLLAGEGLTLALNQMEKTYLDANARPLEIERIISLMQLDAKALLDLQRDGECTIELSERFFDYDFPGHYCRKIKSLTVSIPAVVGPYQSIKAILTQLSNHVIQRPDVSAVNFLLGGDSSKLPGPDILRSNWRINQRVALSRGSDDSGMFQLNFDDNRYLPFEGTGAVSTWRLSIPRQTNRINFDAISDVLVTLRYTAFDGGGLFRQQVTSLPALAPFYGSKLLIFNQQYSQQWFLFLRDHSTPAAQTLRFELPESLIPPHLLKAKLTGFHFLLDVPAGRTAVGAKPYITFQVSDTLSEKFNPDATNSYTHVLQTPMEMSKVFGGRKVVFDLDEAGEYTPPDLKRDGFLNPSVVRNILLVLYYEAEVDWA